MTRTALQQEESLSGFVAQLRERVRTASGVCPTCGQSTNGGTRPMARRIGVSHTSLWRFLAGGAPSADLIDKLVAWVDRTPESAEREGEQE